MIGKMIQKFRARKVKDREIRRLVRKLPVLMGLWCEDEEAAQITQMARGHSFMKRSQRLHTRYLDRKMSYEDWVKYERALSDREVIVKDSIGNTFKVDRKIITRGIARLRKLVG